MLRNCACFQRQRRGSSFEDSSSCRSSEIERGSEVSTSNGSLLKLITSRGWCRQWRKTGSTISMSKIERSKQNTFINIFIIKNHIFVALCCIVLFGSAESSWQDIYHKCSLHIGGRNHSYSQYLFRINYHYDSQTHFVCKSRWFFSSWALFFAPIKINQFALKITQ